jgi:homoserine dehydrogenase
MRKKLNIGLFGFGCVGSGLYEVLERTPGFNARIGKICVKQEGKNRALAPERFTYNMWDILDDPDINVVVELIDDADSAYEIVTAALKRGKPVVSANKKMIAAHLPELLTLQKRHNVPLLYEAACCASIPVIRNLEEYYDNDLLNSIEGIINGSTNFILTRTAEQGIGYDEALRLAQERGFAESDPSLDVSGRDAANKLAILALHAFGTIIHPDEIFTVGIDRLGELEFRYAAEKGCKIRLIARASRNAEGGIICLVAPEFVRPGEWLYGVNDEFNGVITRNTFSDTQFFVGKGAGAFPTASAVLSDLSALTYDYRYEYKKAGAGRLGYVQQEIYLDVFCRHPRNAQGVAECFTEVKEQYAFAEAGFTTGSLSLSRLRELGELPGTSIVLFGINDAGKTISGVVKKELQEA